MQEKTDKRIKRTKYLLLHALTTLLAEKSIKNISVKELCESVDINRGTFYLHYKDIYDLLEKAEQELLCQMEAIFQKYTPDSPNFPCSLFTELFWLIRENADFCRVLLSSNGDISFFIKIKELFDRQCIQKWGLLPLPAEPAPTYEYFSGFTIFGCMGFIDCWLTNGTAEPPEQMAELLTNMLSNGVAASL